MEIRKPTDRLRIAKKNRKKNYSKSYAKYLWKESERNCAEFAGEVDSPDSYFGRIQSKKGRVGHITDLRVDVITENWVWENKKFETYPKKQIEWFINLFEQADRHGKFPVLRYDIQTEIRENTLSLERIPPLYIIPEKVFKFLLEKVIDGTSS